MQTARFCSASVAKNLLVISPDNIVQTLESSYKYLVLRLEFSVESKLKSDMVCKELNMKQS